MNKCKRSCANCKHSEFVQIWGDYKCRKRNLNIYWLKVEAALCDEYDYEEKKFEEDED